jgi:glutathionylspermidine synthase
MRRHTIAPRDHWQKSVERVGLTYHTLDDGSPYWDESAYWEFSAAEIDRLEAATAEIQRLALAAGDAILDAKSDWLSRMHIPAVAVERIRETWVSEPPALYGRLDLAYDGRSIKLLEYNADTPTCLVEAAVAQWYWLEERFPQADQFNSLHEKLVAKWKDLVPYVAEPVYFAHDGGEEDAMTIAYLRDTAQQAGIKSTAIAMRDVGWEEAKKHLLGAATPSRFVDLAGHPMQSVFKLYPWEWLLNDAFGEHAIATMDSTEQKPIAGKVQWIEPIWKMLWSNKALLAVLWELNPNHELLLPAYLDGPRSMQNYVRKPLVGREGAGVTVFRNWAESEYATDKGAGVNALDAKAADGHFVYQQMAPMAEADGKTAVFGSWLIDGEPAGMGIRESDGLVTNNFSRFVPHLFR